jgi:flagellar biosynthesis chaperone FliJ
VGRAEQAAEDAREAERTAAARLAEPTVLTADDLSLRARLVSMAGRTVAEARATLADRQEERARCAEIATAATRDVRALECLRDRVTLRDRAAERVVDQARSDEAAARLVGGRG